MPGLIHISLPMRSICISTIRSAADERRAAHRAKDFPVLHPIRLPHREVELTCERVHAAAAHCFCEEAFAHGAQHFLFIVRAGREEGVRHARGRRERVALPAGAARARMVHQPAAEQVHKIAFQHAVFNEHVAL